jgi:hypothetical protein
MHLDTKFDSVCVTLSNLFEREEMQKRATSVALFAAQVQRCGIQRRHGKDIVALLEWDLLG